MKNSDIENLNLAIGICFSRGNLTEEQCELIRNLDATSIVKNHGLNDMQANRVLSWCKVQEQRHLNNKIYDVNDDN